MNGATQTALKVVVERAVRPVRATRPRKRRMREELLGHLTSIFDEEVRRSGDEQTALDEAKRRFGDPRVLASELQDSVPRTGRFAYFFEQQPHPGESAISYAARNAVLVVFLYAAAIAILLPLMSLHGLLETDTRFVGYLVHIGVAVALLMLVVSLLLSGLRLAIFRGEAKRSFGSLVMVTGFYGLLALLCPVLGLPLLAMTAKPLYRELRYQQEWASLDIGESLAA
jgi:hypothetical protein